MSSSSGRPQVTITLGRSGQVVKRAGSISDVSHTDFKPLSGSKRPIRERLGNNVGDPPSHGSLSKDKRQRMGDHNWNLNNDAVEDSKQCIPSRGVGRDDLRYKLLRKSISKSTNTVPDQLKVDLRQKLSGNCHGPLRFDAQHVLESRASGHARQIPPTRYADDLCHLDSTRKSYTLASNGPRNRTPDRLLGASRAMSPPRLYDDMRHAPPMRSVDVSRPANFMTRSVVDSSRREALASKSTLSVETAKPVMRATLASGTLQKTSYMSEEPLTVASLLHSLGLGKYAILFQAEEVDMAALKQMGDNDLKELGIPMVELYRMRVSSASERKRWRYNRSLQVSGPRKKILLAVLSCSKHRHP